MAQDTEKAALNFPCDRLLSLREVCAILDISRPTLLSMLKANALPYVQINKRRKVRPDALLAFLQNQRG